MKTFLVISNTNCKRNNGFGGWKQHQLSKGLDYDVTDFKVTDNVCKFSLYDEQGWIADYKISKKDFFKNCVKIK